MFAIKHIFVGQKQSIVNKKGKTYLSSYHKQCTSEELSVNVTGFDKDTQSDKEHHGGIDKAVCVYTQDSYDFFKKQYDLDLPLCALGENIALYASDEDICLGDVFQCGEVIFEVCQPRQPCWKISDILGIKNFTSLVTKEHKTGFYLRVLQEGKMSCNDEFHLIKSASKRFSIAFINQCYFNAKTHQSQIKAILKNNALANAYRKSLLRRLDNSSVGIEPFQEDKY